MADNTDFPPPGFPVVFADGVFSIANSPAFVKFYLYRYDPSFAGDGRSNNQPHVQIAMPMDAFASTCIFFEKALASYVAQGLISEKRLEVLRAFKFEPSNRTPPP